MPMIDVYAPTDLLPIGSDRRIGEELTRAVLRAEGVSAPSPFHLENTAAFIHRMDPTAVQTAARAFPRTIRVQIITPPAALTRSGQKQLVKDVTAIMADISSFSFSKPRRRDSAGQSCSINARAIAAHSAGSIRRRSRDTPGLESTNSRPTRGSSGTG